jgi:lipopolysaccharide export LptBFGC system permease protein LptF
MFQSCAAGVVNVLEDNGGSSGSVGFVVALLMLVGGIVSVVTRKSTGKGGSIAIIVLFGFAAVFGFAGYGNYSDLVIWSVWCLINAVIAAIALIKGKHNN